MEPWMAGTRTPGSLETTSARCLRRPSRLSRSSSGSLTPSCSAVTAARWTFVIGPDGKVVYKSDQVKPTADLDNVLAFLGSAAD